MAIPEPGCCDGPNELLRKILEGLPFISTGGGGGSAISVSDESVLLTAGVTSFNFVGGGVTATAVGNAVTVTVPTGGTGDVVGPAVAVSDDIATFNGITGKLIKDSGVAISSIVTNTKLQSATTAIGSGAVTLAVVFGTAFASAPNVVGTIQHPTGDPGITWNILSDTVTTLGFTVRFSAATPNANYKFAWMANL